MEYLRIIYQACFQSTRLNIQVPAIAMPPPPLFEAMAPWIFTPPPDAQVREFVIVYILDSINIIKKPSLIPWSIK
jgi:hypothetical protein